MSDSHTRQDARDTAIRALLPLVAQHGWTLPAVRLAAGDTADLLFPGGPSELVGAYIDLADREMVQVAAPVLAEQRLSRRVRTLIATRLDLAAPYRDAVRRAASVLARPSNSLVAARCTARTVDTIWAAAGDTSADFSWYTKRAILAGVYSTTLFYWLSSSGDMPQTLAFLDRRLAGVAKIGKLKARFAA